MFACAYGAAFGAIQQVQQIVPGLPEVRQMTQGIPPPRAGLAMQEVAANVTKVQEIGGLVGRVALAYLAVVIVSRRKLIRLFQIPGLIVMPITFAIAATTILSWLYVGCSSQDFSPSPSSASGATICRASIRLHLRGTGESFAANIGGRLIGTSFAWLTATLAVTPDRAYAPTKIALVAAAVGFAVYLVGFIASFWLPEPPEGNVARLMRHAIAGALLIAAVSTLGDFVWAGLHLRHRVAYGLAHGTLLFLCMGAYFGALNTKVHTGALYGASIGLAAAGTFYLLAHVVGYAAMFVVWAFIWFRTCIRRAAVIPPVKWICASARRTGDGGIGTGFLPDLWYLATFQSARVGLRDAFFRLDVRQHTARLLRAPAET